MSEIEKSVYAALAALDLLFGGHVTKFSERDREVQVTYPENRWEDESKSTYGWEVENGQVVILDPWGLPYAGHYPREKGEDFRADC